MSDHLALLAERLVSPSNKAKLANFLGTVKDIVTVNGNINILDTGNKFCLTQKDGMLSITASQAFIDHLGDYEFAITSDCKFTNNVLFNMTERSKTESIEFEKNGGMYSTRVGNAFLDCLDNISIVNMMKRTSMNQQMYDKVRTYLVQKGFQVVIKGEQPIDDNAPLIIQVGKESPSIGERIVIKEVPVYVDKVVIKEVPVEVQKIVFKEVPVYVDKIITTQKGPIERVEPKSESGSPSEIDESSVDSEVESVTPPPSPVKIKGKWLDDNKTRLKSGKFVYRVNKKINGPTEMVAIGRWSKNSTKPKPLSADDKIEIAQMGHKFVNN